MTKIRGLWVFASRAAQEETEKIVSDSRLRYLAVILACLSSLVTVSSAAALDLAGCPTKKTPFDHRYDLDRIVFPSIHEESSPESFSRDKLFWQARRFVYAYDRNGDEWQSPRMTEMRQAGDCEDKALWLYTMLKANGYQKVRLVVGHFRSLDKAYHVWIMHRDKEGVTHILDPTMQNRVWRLDQFARGYYRPSYSYDGEKRYRHLDLAQKPAVSCEEFRYDQEGIRFRLARKIRPSHRFLSVRNLAFLAGHRSVVEKETS